MPKLSEFKTEEEEAEFWEPHGMADYWDQLEPVSVTVDPELKAKV